MRANSIYMRHEKGFAEAHVATGDFAIVMFLNLSGDLDEIIAKAAAEKATYENGQTEVTIGVDCPPADPQPGVDWVPGDLVTVDGVGEVQVAAQTFTIDNDTNKVHCVPQLGTVLDDTTQRIDRNFASYGGLAKGTSRLARPPGSLDRPEMRPA